MRKTLLALLLLLMPLTASPPAHAETGLILASGNPGGTLFPLGENMASLANYEAPDFFLTTRSTDGAAENCRLIAEGQVDVGFVLGSVLRQALAGEGPFQDSGPLNLAALARLYPAPEHLVTIKDRGIRTLSDLKGKTVSIGMPCSGNRMFAEEILREAGLIPDNTIRCVELGQRQAAQALAAGKIDAAFWNFALPGSAVLELSAFCEVVLVPLSPAIVDNLVAKHFGLEACLIPAGTYPDQCENILSIADYNYLVGQADMDSQQACLLIGILMDHLKDLAPITSSMLTLSPENAFPGGFPIASGAARYFRKKGIIREYPERTIP